MAESIEFTVSTDKETQLVEMKDMPILKNIRLIKKDSDTDEVIKSDFVFGLYEDPECTKLIQEVKSDKDTGIVIFENLRYGEAFVKEISAPKNYQLSDKVVKITINENGVFADDELLEETDSTCEFVFYNTPMPKVQTGNETNYILLISIAIISLFAIIVGIVVLKRNI